MSLQLPTEEQLALCSGIATFLQGNFPLARFRAPQDAGELSRQATDNVSLQTNDNVRQSSFDDAQWKDLAQMGVLGISLPQADGGMGLSWMDEILVCREAGRYLVSPALIGSIVAARVAARAGLGKVCAALLAGERCAGIAVALPSSEIRVIDGDAGIFLLVDAQRVHLLEAGKNTLRTLACIDDTMRLSAAQMSATHSTFTELACVEDSELILAAHLLAAAMLCGLLEATRDMAADYARTRVQFGRPIGAFQAIKHRCADTALAAELCWSQTLQAAMALTNDAADAEFHVLAAKLLAGEEALTATRFNIQAHGAMGFTDEADAHRLLKRAHVLHQLLGDPRLARARLPDLKLEIC